MKTIRLSSKILAVILTITIYVSCEKWDVDGIKGQGAIVSENITVSEIEGIRSELPAIIYISQGNEQSIRIDAQQNILENIKSSTSDKLLLLSFDKEVKNCEPIKIYVSIKNLKEISISGSGKAVSTSKIYAQGDLLVNLCGSGNIDLDANAQIVNLNISGSGTITLSSICEKVAGNISGSGNIDLEDGMATTGDFKINGSGNIYAYHFPVENCYVSTAGSGDSQILVSEKLYITIAGSGNVYYKGSPVLSVSIAGSGNVVNAN